MVSDAKTCRSRGLSASRVSAARNTTPFTSRNGTGIQKYCVPTGVGTKLARVSRMPIDAARDSRSRVRALETQEARLTRNRRRNWKLVAASYRMASDKGCVIFWAHQLSD